MNCKSHNTRLNPMFHINHIIYRYQLCFHEFPSELAGIQIRNTEENSVDPVARNVGNFPWTMTQGVLLIDPFTNVSKLWVLIRRWVDETSRGHVRVLRRVWQPKAVLSPKSVRFRQSQFVRPPSLLITTEWAITVY